MTGNTEMKRNLLIAVCVLACVIAMWAALLLYGRLSSMSAMHVEVPAASLGPLPMDKLEAAEVAPGLVFRMDMGSSVNTINREYLRRLEALGCEVDSQRVLTYVRTAIGGHRLATKRYRVSLPVYAFVIDVDSCGITSRVDTMNRLNTLHGVDFVLTGSESEMPRFGMPLFKKFKLEYDHRLRALRFHFAMPENYEMASNLVMEKVALSEPRAFLKLGVNNSEHEFFLNSSMPRAGILFPGEEAPKADNVNVYADTILSVYGHFPAIINYDAWVDWEDRSGKNVAYYLDYGSKPYALNPFNFLTQDAVFDFGGGKIYLHPYAVKNKRLRENDLFVKQE